MQKISHFLIVKTEVTIGNLKYMPKKQILFWLKKMEVDLYENGGLKNGWNWRKYMAYSFRQ